ncbi:MAG: hypothetical protein ACI4TK_16215 [Agathobacter sp.]
MKKKILGIVVLSLIVLLGIGVILAGNGSGNQDENENGKVVYLDKTPTNKIYDNQTGSSTSLRMMEYIQYGYECFMDRKTITGEAADALIALLGELEETGEKDPKISDEEFPKDLGYSLLLPVGTGTMWIETGDAIYRIDETGEKICRVDTHYGEGSLLRYEDACKTEINNLWWYWPSDCWYGSYKDGVLGIYHAYAADASVTATVKEICVARHEGSSNFIKLELVSNIDQTCNMSLRSEIGDQIADVKSIEDIELKANEAKTINLTFDGFVDRRYEVMIFIGNTRINLWIDPT